MFEDPWIKRSSDREIIKKNRNEKGALDDDNYDDDDDDDLGKYILQRNLRFNCT